MPSLESKCKKNYRPSKCPLNPQEEYSGLSTNIPDSTRVHASILLLNPSSKLWYLCRVFDQQGSGKVTLTPQRLQILNEAKSTIYRWLKKGQELGLFRRYCWEGNTLKIILGGLFRICKLAKISAWGTTAKDIPLNKILTGNGRRAIATALTIQDWQERSRYTAKNQLNSLERKCFNIPAVADVFDCQTSPKLTSGGIRGVVHVSNKRVFVGRRFIPFGVTQARISDELNSQPNSCGVSVRTVQRHVEQLGVNHKQIMQAKPEYKEIAHRIKQGATHWQCRSDSDISFTWSDKPDQIILHEPNGDSSSRKSSGHQIKLDQMCRYSDAYWRYRCNLYSLDFELTSMRTTRYWWKKYLKSASEVAPETTEVSFSPQTPVLEQSPPIDAEGRLGGGQNKSDKNENPQNPDSEQNSFAPGGSEWEKIRAMLKAKQDQRKQERWNRLTSI